MTTAVPIKAVIFLLLAWPVQAGSWPATPPAIGQMIMPKAYWDWTMEAARKHRVSPYVIQGFMAVESGYRPRATSGHGRCIGLMQLDRDVARSLKVDP